MLAHYLSLALRNVRRAPLASAVNVLSLAIGLAAFLTTYAFVTFWNAAESQFPTADRTYAMTTSFAFTDGSFSRNDIAQTPERAAESLRIDFPALERIARAMPLEAETGSVEPRSRGAVRGGRGRSGALRHLRHAVHRGRRRRRAQRASQLRLTRRAAAELFGADDPLGRPVLIANLVDATVTGVIAEVPQPSHMGSAASAPLRFEVLVSSDVRDALEAARLGEFVAFQRDNWLGNSAWTYSPSP